MSTSQSVDDRLSTAKPIPTEYCGIRFRSRLEARWFIYFQRLGIKALYEHEGYQLASGWYLPDFWLPSMRVFVEVKPTAPSPQEIDKCEGLASHTGCDVALVVGPPATFWEDMGGGALFFQPDSGYDDNYFLCRCRLCGRMSWQYQGRWTRIQCGCNAELKREATKSNEGRGDCDAPGEAIANVAEFAERFQF